MEVVLFLSARDVEGKGKIIQWLREEVGRKWSGMQERRSCMCMERKEKSIK